VQDGGPPETNKSYRVGARHATPLRYPGGKQRLTPFVREILHHNALEQYSYCEPFAGGAGVAIELLLEGDVSSIHLNDSAYPIYCFWSVLKSNPDYLCSGIRDAILNVEQWRFHKSVLSSFLTHSMEEVALSTLILNRCNRSGVLSGGVIGGLGQRGNWKMDARFPRNELIRRIERIAYHSDQICVTNKDASELIKNARSFCQDKTLFYLDPPYFHKSSRLYLDYYKPSDHSALASLLASFEFPWIVSYDDTLEVSKLYEDFTKFSYTLRYSAAAASIGQELFVFGPGVEVPKGSQVDRINVALRGESLRGKGLSCV
jgi:DNA adenine methylase